ncbi:hypothetical protein RBH26_09970 [Natronolimnohabitans sp. A-GB9]|nr:hypothetical protein [Natronolimnohabitans sp. A-GB9]MDQ2050810.1 hypothetical protein [Natronolimnohabitans sp. A-GB9]
MHGSETPHRLEATERDVSLLEGADETERLDTHRALAANARLTDRQRAE